MVATLTLWAQSNANDAMTWIDLNAPKSVRPTARLHVFNRWADANPGEALRWLKAQKSGESMDEILWYFTTDSTLRYVDREKALEALSLIQDEQLREKATEHVCLIWARSESEAAAAFVQNAQFLTPAEKASLAEKIRAVGSSKTSK